MSDTTTHEPDRSTPGERAALPTRTAGRRRRPRAALALLVLPLAVVVAACGDDSGSAGASNRNRSTPTTTAASGATSHGQKAAADVTVADTGLGRVLADGKGRVLYAFTPDSATKSACNAGCSDTWPPATANGTPTADGVAASELSVITRDDGSKQLAFHGHPLYTYVADTRPGQTNGQGIGGNWYVVNTRGGLVENDGSGASGSGSGSGSGY